MLQILSDKKRRAFYSQHLGEIRTVLFEHEQHASEMYGFTDNYIKVCATYDPLRTNELVAVKLESIDENGLVSVADADYH